MSEMLLPREKVCAGIASPDSGFGFFGQATVGAPAMENGATAASVRRVRFPLGAFQLLNATRC